MATQPGPTFFANAQNASVTGAKFYNVNRDVYTDFMSLSDTIETIQAAVPVILEEIQKIQFPTTNRNTNDRPSEDDSQVEGESVAIEMAESGPSPSLETESIADIYTRSMIKCLEGYPLYNPQPCSDSEEYTRKGVRVGDVGIVTKDGAFDFLFNVCPSQNSLINPRQLPSGFTLDESEEPTIFYEEQFPHGTHLFDSPVSRNKNLFRSPIYTSSQAGGAILELPEGASRYGAANLFPFRRLASRSGEDWYKYVIGTCGRKDISNGSLFLVTACTKCTQWGIAVSDIACTPQDGLRFVQNKGLFRDSSSKYSWKGSSAFTTKVAPSPGDSPNQCVFVDGLRITLRQDIFYVLCNDLFYRPPQASTSSRSFLMGSNPDISIPAPQSVDHLSGHPSIPPAPPIASEPQVLADPEYHSIGRGEAQQDREAGHGVDPDFSIPQGAPTITAELHSVDSEDRVMQREDAPPTSSFQGSSNDEIVGSNVDEVHGDATIIQFDDGRFTDVQRNLIRDYTANHIPAVPPGIKNNLSRHVLTQSIMTLPRAEAAFKDYQTKKKSEPCFEGTRVALLREMAHWFTSPDGFRMYVLSGPTGIGKSTIAYTIASRAADLDLLCASFFFSRGDANCKNAKKFFTTLAYQLCVYDETFAKAIGDVLKTERGAAAITKNPREQLQALILEPLQSIVQSRVRPMLVVVDALNECDEGDEHAVVKGLNQLIREFPSFKVILTTRPRPSFPFFGSHGSHKVFYLQDIEHRVVDSDIRLFLRHHLSLLQIPERQWCVSDEQIESLVRASRRLFIIASRAVRYILDESVSNPAAQMEELLHEFAQGRMPFKDLDELQQDFDLNFGQVVFGWGTIVGVLIAVLVHQR